MTDHLATPLHEALGVDRLAIFFQPIITLKRGRTIGHEALLRGRVGESTVRSPADLFAEAQRLKLLIDLERAARELAIQAFATKASKTGGLLFLNFSSWLLDSDRLEPGLIGATCERNELPTKRVAIEIVESGVEDLEALRDFAERNRETGFVITLDDFGTQHSNLERVALVQPDVIKIDRSIITGVAGDLVRRSVLRSVVYLARVVGALALAEGIEEYEDLVVCAREGVDLAQGFLIGEPVPSIEESERIAAGSLKTLMPNLERDLTAEFRSQITFQRRFEQKIRRFVDQIQSVPEAERIGVLHDLVDAVDEIECAFLVRPDGTQYTETILRGDACRGRDNACFIPAKPGDSHALKEYIYGLMTLGHDRYLTDRYVSLASGRLVRTLALRLTDRFSEEFVLCVDLFEDENGCRNTRTTRC